MKRSVLLLVSLLFLGTAYSEKTSVGLYGLYGYLLDSEETTSGYGVKAGYKFNENIMGFVSYEGISGTEVKDRSVILPEDLYVRNFGSSRSYTVASKWTSLSIDSDVSVIFFGIDWYPMKGSWFIELAAGIPDVDGDAQLSNGSSRSANGDADTSFRIGTGWTINLSENAKMDFGINATYLNTEYDVNLSDVLALDQTPLSDSEKVEIDYSNASAYVGIRFNF